MSHRIIKISCFLFCFLFSFISFAFEPPAHDGHVTDIAKKLSSEEEKALETQLSKLNDTTGGNQIAVLILPSIGDEDIKDVSYDTFNKWGVGEKGLDNGILILLAIKERKVRIETGKGVEGEITDLRANEIIKKVMVPKLKSGDFNGAIVGAVNELSVKLEDRSEEKTSQTVQDVESSATFVLWIVLGLIMFVGGCIAFMVWSDGRKRKQRMSKYDASLYSTFPPPPPLPSVPSYQVSEIYTSESYTPIYKTETVKPAKRTETSTPSYSSKKSSPSYSSPSISISSSSSSSYSSGSDGGYSGGGFSGGDSGGGGADGGW